MCRQDRRVFPFLYFFGHAMAQHTIEAINLREFIAIFGFEEPSTDESVGQRTEADNLIVFVKESLIGLEEYSRARFIGCFRDATTSIFVAGDEYHQSLPPVSLAGRLRQSTGSILNAILTVEWNRGSIMYRCGKTLHSANQDSQAGKSKLGKAHEPVSSGSHCVRRAGPGARIE